MNDRLRRPDRHRHRRGARLRPRDRRTPSPARGATVWACDVWQPTGCAETGAAARRAPAMPDLLDVSDRACGRGAVDRAAAGAVDILVNNAGGVRGQVGPPARGDQRGRLAGDLRRQPHRRLLLPQAVAPGMKRAGLRPDRQHLERRRPRHQPDRHPGLCQRQGRADRPHPPACARARAVRHHGQQRRAGLRPLQPDHRAAVGGDGRGGPDRAGREHRDRAGSAARRTSRMRRCSSPPTSPAGSPARC